MHTKKKVIAAVVGGLAAVALTVLPADAGGDSRAKGSGRMSDLLPDTAQPTDGAHATARAFEHPNGTTVVLELSGLDASIAGTELGAHVHTGTCVKGNGAAAGPHYNAGGGISDETEVWLDFVVQTNGRGYAVANVPFFIPAGGAHALVVHAMHTDHGTGAAGARWACLKLDF